MGSLIVGTGFVAGEVELEDLWLVGAGGAGNDYVIETKDTTWSINHVFTQGGDLGCVLLQGSLHRLSDMTLNLTDDIGMLVTGDNNQVDEIYIASPGGEAIHFTSAAADNLFSNIQIATAWNGAGTGPAILIDGDDNTLTQIRVRSNAGATYAIEIGATGDANTIGVVHLDTGATGIINDGGTNTVIYSDSTHTHAAANVQTAYVIAADDSTTQSKDNADEVLDGVDDDVEINAALTSHGHVHLMQGTFDIGAPIEMVSFGWLEGGGYKTILKANGITTGDRAVIVSKANTARAFTISDLTVDGDFAAGGPCHGIRLRNTGQDLGEPDTGADNYIILRNLFIDGNRSGAGTTYKGIWLESASADQRSNYLHNISIRESGAANLHIDGSSDNTLTNVHVGPSNQYGFWVAGANNRLTNCKSFFADGHAFFVTSSRNTLTAIEAQDVDGADGIHITGANTTIAGALVNAELAGRDMEDGIHLAASRCSITGYDAQVGAGTMDNGINFVSGTDNYVAGTVDSGMDSAQIAGTPGANSFVRVVRTGTSVYTFGVSAENSLPNILLLGEPI